MPYALCGSLAARDDADCFFAIFGPPLIRVQNRLTNVPLDTTAVYAHIQSWGARK